MPAGLVRILDRALNAAGVPRRDERDWRGPAYTDSGLFETRRVNSSHGGRGLPAARGCDVKSIPVNTKTPLPVAGNGAFRVER